MNRWLAVLVGVVGCVTSHGTVGVIGPSADVVGTKLLKPGVVGRSCRTRVFGVARGGDRPQLTQALGKILAEDEEGDIVLNADVRTSVLVTGVYNRHCLEVQGDLGRTVPTIAVPGPSGHAGHGAHH